MAVRSGAHRRLTSRLASRGTAPGVPAVQVLLGKCQKVGESLGTLDESLKVL